MTNRSNEPSRSRVPARQHLPAPAVMWRSSDDTTTQFWSMVASSHDAVLTSALDGTIVTWNAGSLHLYGYSAEEVVGHPVSMLLAPEHAAEWRAVMDRIGRAESPDPFDTVCVRKDGRHLDVSLSVSPLADRHGRLVGAAAFSHDITAHMQTVADLRRTLAQLIESQGLSRLGSWEWDIPTNTMRWSEDLYRLYGGNPADVAYPNALDLVHPDDRTLVRESIDRACRDGGSYVCEHRVVRADGSIRWWENRGTALPDAHGNPLKLFGTVKDISEQKRRDQALAHHGALIESSDDAIITKTLDGTILSWSPGAERLYGYRAEEVVGHPLSIIVPADRPGEVEAILQRITRGQHVAQHETVQVRKDGTRLDISWSVSPIKDTRGKLIAASAIARDITEWKQVAEALARSRAQLRDFAGRLRSASEKERSFIAREIHDELGQALTALKMDLFSLRNGLPASARARLEPETTEMATLIDVMVDKVRTLAAELRPAVLDNFGLAAAVEWAVQQFSRRTGIRCELDLPAGHLELDADRSIDVFRILQETLANVARHAEASRIDVHLRVTPGELVLEVHDNGRGINPSEIESVASFGLLGMRERALLWGGEIGIRAAPQGGTCAVVCIPLATAASGATA